MKLSLRSLWTEIILLLLMGLFMLSSGCEDPRIRKVEPDRPNGGKTDPVPIPPREKEKPAEISQDLKFLIAASKQIAATGYRFLPGDLVEVTVYEYPELKIRIRIPRDREFSFPMIGLVRLQDKTVKELEHEIRTRLEKTYIPKAQVSVLPVEFAERTVYITGNVAKSGAYRIPPMGTLSLIQLLSLSGGFTDDADRDNILLVRQIGNTLRKTYNLNYDMVERMGIVDVDVYLQPGDQVLVAAQQKVYVLGSVNKPGGFSIGAEGLTASKAVALAGGFTRLAAPNSTVVIREHADGTKTTFRVPLSSILELGNEEMDLDLKPGDVIYIPESLF